MRINRIDTKSYFVSAEAEEAALRHFKEKAAQIESESKGKCQVEVKYHYTPIAVLSAIKRDMEGKGILIRGMENKFHVGLRDACFYIFSEKGYSDSLKDSFVQNHEVRIERLNLILDIATLSPKALQTLGFLLDHGTMPFDKLDMPTQTAAKELAGRKYADIYRPVDREGDLTAVFREIVEFQPVTPIWKVKPMLPAPRFMNTRYDLSSRLALADVVEDEVELEKIGHAPEKLQYILGTLFNCSIMLERIVYLPYADCSYSWEGKHFSEIRYLPCFKSRQPKKYGKPKKLKTILLGTKGHGLGAIPFEDVTINFTNVAGMEDVKKRLTEGIIYPLAHPELSKEFGTKGGGGILLYGPPGCGKTYIMRAAVGEAGVNFFSVEIPEILGGSTDGSAAKLDEAFNEARSGAPAILFFDEIEALGGSRSSAQGGTEHRLVNQFLTDMEGVGASNENVLIVGSTNAPWEMDAALRRSGRFTDHIFISPPDFEARLQMFKINTKGRPVAQELDFNRLAELTENYSSADITAICDEAAKIPWSESVHGSEKRNIVIDDFLAVLDQRESTLVPWLRTAEKQLRDSGEADVFPELADYVFKRAGGIEMVSQPKLKFKDVGGLESVKEEIRNKIVYPLKNPQAAKQYGRKIGGGMLFYGPPGCGKTYVAKATAGECEASFFNVKITDLLSPEEGVTEKRLHSIFERASRNVPAIIFFDEIDAIAGTRSSSEGATERRLINQFLTEMDGFEKKEGVVVLAATNAPWDIDPALRRAGRFSDQIFLPPPDEASRLEIFKLSIDGRPIADDVDFAQLSNMTEGYSSADINLVCDEAAKIPWKESMKSNEHRPISMDDYKKVLAERKSSITPWLKQAEKQLRTSGESEVYHELSEYVFKRAGGLDMVSAPKMNFSNVGGLDEVKEDIRSKIVYPLKNPALAKEYGRTISGGILLFGPPGCGKTYIARATAGEVGASFFNVKMTDLLSPVEGESEKRLHGIFERANRNTPAVVFFDEVDAVAGKRSSAEGGAERRLINQFLTEMDGFEKKEGVVVLAATNAPWDIDPALRRAGRFSDQIFLPPPNAKGREEVFRIHCATLPVEEGLDYSLLSALTDGYSSADIKLICEEAAKIPWKEGMETGKKRPLRMPDFQKVISLRHSSLTPWFQQAKEQLSNSNEETTYPALAESIRQYFQVHTAGEKEHLSKEVSALTMEREGVEQMIEELKDRFRSGDIDLDSLKTLAKEYQRKIIEIDAKIKLLQRERPPQR